MSVLIATLIFIFLVQIFFFTFAAIYQTDKLTDLSYGLTFILASFFVFLAYPHTLPKLLLTFMVSIWGARLGYYLFIRILKTKTDARFDGIRNHFWKFALFWFFQAFAVWIILLPTTIFLSSLNPTPFSSLGLIIWLLGFSIEALSDHQKYTFRNNPQNKDHWVNTGLWRYSRHPNYFGEMTLWWGVFIFTLPSLQNGQLLSIISPVFITFVLIFVSGIPPLERYYNKKYAGNSLYQHYKLSTSPLIPLPPK